jgi:hypothetical protein
MAPDRHHFSKVLDYKDYLLDPIAPDELAQISDILLTRRKQGASMPEFAYDCGVVLMASCVLRKDSC